MDKKHLGLGLLIGFGFMTYFLIEVHSAYRKQEFLKHAFVGVLNGESIYRDQLEESFATKINTEEELEKYFRLFVDKKLIELEASKLEISSEEFLSFFDSLTDTEPTEEEIEYFPKWPTHKIQSTRAERAREALLKQLRKQNKIQFHSKTGDNSP